MPDLWRRLQELLGIHLVTPVWVRGHADNAGNARCDELASGAALRPGLPPGYGLCCRRMIICHIKLTI